MYTLMIHWFYLAPLHPRKNINDTNGVKNLSSTFKHHIFEKIKVIFVKSKLPLYLVIHF